MTVTLVTVSTGEQMEDFNDAPSLRESPERRLNDLLALLPWRQRWSLRVKWFVEGVINCVPGYPTVQRLRYRVRRQGLSGLFEPPFNIALQNQASFDRRLRWHGWGVLSEADGFRAYTPTRCTDAPLTLSAAWSALEGVYLRGGDGGATWRPISTGNRNDGASLKNTAK